MTKKDYELIARALKSTHQTVNVPTRVAQQWANDVCAIADALAQDNPRFDRERFLAACGVAS